MQILRFIVNHLLFPPGANLLLLFCGALLLRRAPRAGRALLWTGIGTLWLLAMPLVSSALTRATGSFSPYEGRDIDAQAIVILAAERREGTEVAGSSVGPRTLERLQMGAHWARATGLPLLLSGGRTDPDDAYSMAELMAQALHAEFGVDARWLENESRNTRENALRSAAVLRAAGISRVILVTHYAHMRRAATDFAAAGLQVVPAPTDFPTYSWGDLSLRRSVRALWPSARSLEDSALALHEIYAQAGRVLGFEV